ncbi:MAG: head-tail connector protein [Acidaminococcaceae bacterium]
MATMGITLLKQHVRADDFSDDDNYLSHLLEAAEQYVQTATNRRSDELLKLGDGAHLPVMLQHAVLMIAGHWYNQREAVSGVQMAEVPYTLQALIKPYRKLEREV